MRLVRKEHPFQGLNQILSKANSYFRSFVMRFDSTCSYFCATHTPQNPYDLATLDLMDSRLAPGEVGSTGMTHWLGTDDQGRDLYSAIIYGLRISPGVGLFAGFIALVLGTTVGLCAAFFGGRTDTIVMRMVEFQLSFPAILIALIMLAVLGQGWIKL